jgi:hypothetical protein
LREVADRRGRALRRLNRGKRSGARDQASVKHGEATSVPAEDNYFTAMQRASNSVQLLMQAEEATSAAAEMQDGQAKLGMLSIAAGYRRLAEHADAIASTGVPVEMDSPDILGP